MEILQAVIKSTFGVFLDLISRGVKGMIDFASGLESVGDFFNKIGDIIKENLQNRIDGLIKSFGDLSNVFSQLIDGEFKKAKDAAWDLAKSFAQATTGIKTEDLDAFGESLSNAATQAERLAKQNIALRSSIRGARVAASEAQREAERNRKQRDDEFKSLEERLALNREVLKFEQVRLEELKKINKAEQQLVLNQIALAGGRKNATEEQLDQLSQLRAEYAELEEDFLGRTTEQLTEANAITREALQIQVNLRKAQLEERILLEELAGKELLDKQLEIIEKEKEAAGS